MPTSINIIGCGIIGATIAYELSCLDKFQINVYDATQPAQASTGAALGVLMGVISQKVKGRGWKLREDSLRRYNALIPELERATGLKIPHNRQGILKLLAPEQDLSKWLKLADIRKQQQWELELWESSQVSAKLPQVNNQPGYSAVYSPQDLQVDPVAMTMALIAGAQLNGVKFHFNRSIDSIIADRPDSCDILTVDQLLYTSAWTIVTAALGATKLLAPLASIEINPVLGQAIHLRLPQPAKNPDFQPVISYEDVHIVPLENNEYWIGATVEFPVDGSIVAQAESLARIKQIALDICPNLAQGEILKTWQGLRPRPHQRPAPIIETVGANGRVIVATGHYRNGVLLAPATAQIVEQMLGI